MVLGYNADEKALKGCVMKIAILCDSPLLHRALEYYLKDYLTSYRKCDFVIADKKIETDKPLCLVSTQQDAHIQKPFTPAQLLVGIENFAKSLKLYSAFQEIGEGHRDYALKCKIEAASARFAEEIYWIITEYYEQTR